MIRGLHSAASGMFVGQRRQEVLTNNLTNVHTSGYKQDEAIARAFPEMLIHRIREQQGNGVNPSLPERSSVPIGRLPGAVYTHEIVPVFTQGPVMRTDNPFDVAIEQDMVNINNEQLKAYLFFTVSDPEGNLLFTRDGRWTTDSAGRLVTFNGNLVLDSNGNPIEVGNREIEVRPNGLIRLIDPNLDPADPGYAVEVQLGLARFENPGDPDQDNPDIPNIHSLVKEQNGYFRWVGEEAIQPLDLNDPELANWRYSLAQGAVEMSNVDVTKTMTQMMENLRFYEANQRVFQATDRTLEKAVNEIGRV